MTDTIYLFEPGKGERIRKAYTIQGLNNPALLEAIDDAAYALQEEIALIQAASHPFNSQAYLSGQLTPVFFGSALSNFGVEQLLDDLIQISPDAQSRHTTTRIVSPSEKTFSGFVFKIQANTDPLHRDRIAFLRICSGRYYKGMKAYQVRLKRSVLLGQALTFMAGERDLSEVAYPGDIIGIHNHGTIQIGDTFTEDETLQFTGVPHFAPELFRQVRMQDPLKQKKLLKGLGQLCEEGATQLFYPLDRNELILGAIGVLQFDVVAYRLEHEYGVTCLYEAAPVATARWIYSEDKMKLEQFKRQHGTHLAVDNYQSLVYLAPSKIHLNLIEDRWPMIHLASIQEHGAISS